MKENNFFKKGNYYVYIGPMVCPEEWCRSMFDINDGKVHKCIWASEIIKTGARFADGHTESHIWHNASRYFKDLGSSLVEVL